MKTLDAALEAEQKVSDKYKDLAKDLEQQITILNCALEDKKKTSDQSNAIVDDLRDQILTLNKALEASKKSPSQSGVVAQEAQQLRKRRNTTRMSDIDSTEKMARSQYSGNASRTPSCTPSKGKPDVKKGSRSYEVEALLDHKCEKSTWFFLVRWKGFSTKHDEWVEESGLNCSKMLKEYREQNGLTAGAAMS